MKKIILLLVILLGLGYWVMNLVKKDKKPISTIVEEDRAFGIENIGDVSKIYLLKRNGKKVKLEKVNDQWILNDTFQTRKIMTDILLKTMKKIQVYYALNKKMTEGVVKQLSTNHIKVEAYNDKNELIKCYYVGNATLDGEGSYMILENANKPYAVHDPQKIGSLGQIFGIHGDEWIDRTIYDFDPKNIAKVSIDYNFNKDNSFELTRDGRGFKLSKLNKEPVKNIKLQSNVVIEDYLNGFKSKIAEKLRRDKKDSPFISSINPFCTIRIWDKEGNVNEAIYYPTEAELAKEKSESYIQKYYVLRNDGIMVKGQHGVLKELFVSYEFFLK